MPEINSPPCPLHGSLPRALHEPNFEGIVTVIDEILLTISGTVGTSSYTRCPYGYTYNFEGVVRALEDLNASISGIQGGGSNLVAGSGIYTTISGDYTVINNGIIDGSGIYISYSGNYAQINATITSVSGALYTAGSGLYLSDGGTRFNANYDAIFQNSVSGHLVPQGSVSISYSGNYALISGAPGGGNAIISGDPGDAYNAGSLWFDTNQGRLFVYASGNGVSQPAWYQTNTDAIALKGELPPSGAGLNAPPRDGSLWFNTLMGNLFVYDATSSGWYETGPSRSFAYGPTEPATTSTPGAGWYDTTNQHIRVWTGTGWVQA
jgi:hypothetical protein